MTERENTVIFLNLKNQICEDRDDFAFYCATANNVLSFNNRQIFTSFEDFALSYRDSYEHHYGRTFNEFNDQIPEDYFDK